MKKTTKKLALSKESLRHLAAAEMEAIAGGYSRTFCQTNCGPCPDPLSAHGSCTSCEVC